MTWAMKQAPVKKTKTAVRNRMVLTYLADRYNDDTRACWPSLDLIAKELDTSKTTIQRSIKELEDQGLIRRTSPNIVAHIPEYRRPTVWTLSLHLRREDMGSNVDTRSYVDTEGSNVDHPGVPTLEREGSNVDHLTQREPSCEPKENPYGASDSGEALDAHVLDPFEEWWEHVPRKKAKGDARKAFNTAIKKTDLPTLIAGIEASKRQWQSEGRDSSKLPYPATWLRAESWEDEQDTWQAPRDNSNSLAAWGAPSTRMNTPTQQQTRFPSIWDLKEIE